MNIDLSKALRQCNKCKTSKKLEAFGKESRRKDGRRTICKVCHKQTQDIWEKKNKVKRKTQAKDWELQNKERKNQQRNKRRKENPEKYREQEKMKYAEDIEYRKKKIERASLQTYKRRLIEKERCDGTLNINATRELFNNQGGVCKHCGIDLIEDGVVKHLDHIIPISLGGLHSIYNVQRLCSTCNLVKGNRFIG